MCRVQFINDGVCPRNLTTQSFAVCRSSTEAENLVLIDLQMSTSNWTDYECGKMIEGDDKRVVFPWTVHISKFTRYP